MFFKYFESRDEKHIIQIIEETVVIYQWAYIQEMEIYMLFEIYIHQMCISHDNYRKNIHAYDVYLRTAPC